MVWYVFISGDSNIPFAHKIEGALSLSQPAHAVEDSTGPKSLLHS